MWGIVLKPDQRPTAAEGQAEKGRSEGQGESEGKGKRTSLTVWDKEMLLQQYEKIVQTGVPNPKNFGKPKGYFHRELGAQEAERVRCSAMPPPRKKNEEVPNHVRSITHKGKRASSATVRSRHTGRVCLACWSESFEKNSRGAVYDEFGTWGGGHVRLPGGSCADCSRVF